MGILLRLHEIDKVLLIYCRKDVCLFGEESIIKIQRDIPKND